MISISTISVASPIKSRVRIIDVEFEDETIKVDETFIIAVNITKQRYLRFDGEIHVYLTCTGVMGEKIGENISVSIPRTRQDNHVVYVTCDVSDVEADWFNENYGLRIELYGKIGEFLVKKDTYSIESIRVVSRFWDKDKLKISDFRPPKVWPKYNESEAEIEEGQLGSIHKKGQVIVNLSNDGLYDYDVVIVVYLVEKTSLGVPFIEGFGEYVKEIGRTSEFIKSGEQDTECYIECELRTADHEKINKTREFDVQAVLYTDIDGKFIELDASSVQTIKAQFDDWMEEIIFLGPWIWVVFIAALGTFILLLVTIKLIIPFTQLKGDEVQEAVENVRKKRKGTRRNRKKDRQLTDGSNNN